MNIKMMITLVNEYTEVVSAYAGMGCLREHVLERLSLDKRILSIGGGTYEIMNELIAKQMGI